ASGALASLIEAFGNGVGGVAPTTRVASPDDSITGGRSIRPASCDPRMSVTEPPGGIANDIVGEVVLDCSSGTSDGCVRSDPIQEWRSLRTAAHPSSQPAHPSSQLGTSSGRSHHAVNSVPRQNQKSDNTIDRLFRVRARAWRKPRSGARASRGTYEVSSSATR